MRLSFITTLLLLSLTSFSQDASKIASIVNEGKKLYRSEMASWYGTDIFLEKFAGYRDKIGGYFSYSDKDTTRCLFFSRDEKPIVLAVISFDSTYNTTTATINSTQRDLTAFENDIYLIRKKALEIIRQDTLFKRYNNSDLNIIPLIENGEKKVFVLTGPKVNGVVIFGNDCLLVFDNETNLISKKTLHKNIIPINYGEKDENVVGTMHTHLEETGDYITSTDICTLMLYEKFAKWEQHIVISDKYISIWDCKENKLTTLTKKAWDKINNHK